MFLLGYEFADFGSGVYHWSLDNYGSARTPVFGKQIEGFQGHHTMPWTITHRETINNIAPVCMATLPVTLFFLTPWVSNPLTLVWGLSTITFINLSQEIHKWSHSH